MTIYSFDVLLFLFGTSLLFHSSSNCCFLICIQIFQEAGEVVWYSCLFQNFPQFVVIHTVKGFGTLNKAEIDVFFWNSLAFSMIQQMLVIWSLAPLPFLNPAWTSGSSWFMYFWGIFLTQGSNPGLLHCRQIIYHLSLQGSLIHSRSKDQSDLIFFITLRMSSEVSSTCHQVRNMPSTGHFFYIWIENLLFSFSKCFLFLSGRGKKILRTVVTCCQIEGSLSLVV